MPKGRRRANKDRSNGSGQTSDEESFNDNASLYSCGSSASGGDSYDYNVEQEAFEDNLMEALDGLMQKSAAGRTTCLEAISKAFIRKYMPDFVNTRYLSICDGIEKGLKKGKSVEQAAAAQLAPLLCVQLGAGPSSEEVCNTLKPILITTANDPSVQPLARAKCCNALGLIIFLACEDLSEVQVMMKVFETIFSGSYLKGDGTVPNITVEMGALHAAALSSWTLMFTLMSSNDVYNMLTEETSFSPSISQLSELLNSQHLEVRLAAGEALANVFELGRDCHEDFAESYISDLVDTLRGMANESHKYRAKKDRKLQRATFREVVNYIENEESPDYKIKFGTEQLELDSWTRRKQYDSFCTMLGSGINIHLAENELLRDIFELGEPLLPCENVVSKLSKNEKRLINAASFKARTISRNKNRDKRSDF